MMNSIAIFCGSALGSDPLYAQIAEKVGQTLAARHQTLVYGGGRSGLMGIIADSALAAGGKVIGMHERKTRMSELAQGFIAIPGGAGTLEEIFEQWTWAQLGIHKKPCAFLNVDGFYDDLLKFIHMTTEKGFTKARFSDALIVSDNLDDILRQFESYQPPEAKWGMVDQTDLVK